MTNPEHYAMFVGSGHGFIIGMFAFFFGFYFVALGKSFWDALAKVKSISLVLALSLFVMRYLVFEFSAPNYLTAIESINWIFSVFGFGHKYLNKPSKLLSYLSESVYPVYIVHMIFLYWAAYYIVPLDWSLEIKLVTIVILTVIGCYLSFEVLRRIKYVRPLFGMKMKKLDE